MTPATSSPSRRARTRTDLVAQCKDRLNLNDPFPARDLDWAKGVVTGDFGQNVVGQDREFTVKARSQRRMVTRRFFRHRLAMISLGVFVFVILVSFVGAALWKWDYAVPTPVDPDNLRGAATLDLIPWLDGDGLALGDHPFGKDNVGRDYMALTMRGSQRSIIIALTVGVVATLIGTVLGALAGFYRGWVDNVLMRAVDVVLTIPLLLIAAVLGRRAQDIPVLNSVFEGENQIYLVAFAIALATWASLSRVIRGEFLSLREKEFVEAARAIGTRTGGSSSSTCCPNVVGSIIVACNPVRSRPPSWWSRRCRSSASGVQSPRHLARACSSRSTTTALTTRPWLFWWPGVFIIAIALSINFIGTACATPSIPSRPGCGDGPSTAPDTDEPRLHRSTEMLASVLDVKT